MSKIKRKDYTYAELAKIGQRYYNDAGFCGVIALSTAAQVSYGKARAYLERSGRITRKGTTLDQQIEAGDLLGISARRDYPLISQFYGKPVSVVTRSLSQDAVWYITTKGHIFCMANGVVNDWMKDRKFKVTSIYKIERNY